MYIRTLPEGKEICKCNIEQEDSTFRAMAVGQSECRQNDCASQKGSLHSQSVLWANEPLLWLVHWRFHLLSPRLSRCGPKLFIILIVLKQHRNYASSLCLHQTSTGPTLNELVWMKPRALRKCLSPRIHVSHKALKCHVKRTDGELDSNNVMPHVSLFAFWHVNLFIIIFLAGAEISHLILDISL